MGILDRRDGDDRPFTPFGNGKGEWARWLLSMLVAAIVAYAAASNAVSIRLTALETKQAVQYDEIQRALGRIERWMERREDAGK